MSVLNREPPTPFADPATTITCERISASTVDEPKMESESPERIFTWGPEAPPPEGTRAGRADKRMMETEWRPESLVIAQTLARHAEARGITPGQFAVAWVLNNRLVTAPIAGPRTEAQWEDYVGALAYRFTAEDEALVDGLVAPGHPSSPGYNDPAYPLEGRVPLTGAAA